MFHRADYIAGSRARLHSLTRVVGVSLALLGFTVGLNGPSYAANSPPAMIVPGQFNVGATGAATYTIPIAVPPGSAGMVPALSLDYSSQSGDGIEGIGWTLSGLPSISRCPRTIAQDSVHGSVNYDSNDRLCMEGQRLMPVTGSTYGTNGAIYRTEVDGFSKILEHNAINGTGGSAPWFEVWTKAGQHMEFGNTTDSQILTVGLTTNVVRAWAVDKISDTVGNYLTVTYNCTAVSGACTDSDRTTYGEAYPLEVDYTGNAAAGVNPYNSVKFSYTSRTDSVPTYQAGALTQTTELLSDVKTYQSTNLVHDYQLGYRPGTTTTHSRLISVKLFDGSGHYLNATTFGWQGGSSALSLSSPTNETAFPGDTLFPTDFNGDGYTDALAVPGSGACPPYDIFGGPNFTSTVGSFSFTPGGTMPSCEVSPYAQTIIAPNGAAELLLPLLVADSGTFASYLFPFNSSQPTSFPFMYLGSSPSIPPVFAGDFNGDGITDMMVQGTPTNAYFGNTGGGFGSAVSYGNYNPSAIAMAIADFDGDGCADLYTQSGTTPSVTYASACNPAAGSAAVLPTISSGYTPVFGDFNGDGKTDILLVSKTAAAQLWLATGNGFVEVNSAISGSSDWGNYTVQTGDWNGDGKADIVLVSDGSTGHYGAGHDHLFYLSTGSDFTAARDSGGSAITIANPVTCASAMGKACVNAVIADWNSDGNSDFWLQDCFLGAKPACTTAQDYLYNFAYVPELMTSVSNGIGSTTTVSYTALNSGSPFYSKGSSVTFPTQILDGPIYVVSRVDASNGLGTCTPPSMSNCYSSTYAYVGAQTDLQGRGFLGFVSIAVTDLQTNVVQTTTYSTTFPFTGMMTSQTKVHSATTLSTVTNTLNDNASCDSSYSSPGSGIYMACITQSVSANNDLNGSAFPTTTTSYTYDQYGNALTVNVSMTGGSSKNTTNTYNNDTTNWFLGRLLTTSVNSIVGPSNLTRASSFTYDTGTGLLNQEVVAPGVSTCNGGSSSCTLTTNYTYDSFGHRIATIVSGSGITARTSTAAYDSLGEFQISATNVLGQSETWAYDARFGEPTSHTGPNGLTTSWTYDSFGRMTLETRPDGTETSESYIYCSGSCPANGQFYAQAEPLSSGGSSQIGPISTAYYDMLSRAIAKDIQGFDGSNIRVATQYDGNGRVQQTSRPYFTSSGTPAWTSFTYDDLGRITQTTFPDASHTTYGFNALVTTVTNNLSQVTTTTKNAQGLTASVQDAASHTTSYVYDAFDNPITITDPAGNVVTNSYDIRGNKYASNDPDMGSWSYVHDVLGELTSQIDAKSQTTTITYDLLGRMATRSETGLYSTWTYGASPASHNVGQLVEAKACTSSGTCTLVSDRTFVYDSLGRPIQNVLHTASDFYGYSTTYNLTNGRIDTVTSPSGFAQRSIYNTYGYVCKVVGSGGSPTCASSSGAPTIYTVSARDAELHLIQSIEGNGVSVAQAFDSNTGLIQTIRAGGGGAVASFNYTFDTIGNLTARTDNDEGFTEKYCFDSLNRLTNSATGSSVSTCTSSGAGITTKSVAYDSIGNITSKSDLGTGTYHYPSSGSARPHAVSSITGTVDGLTNPLYGYDGDGNLTCVSTGSSCSGTVGRTVSLTSFNMASTLTQGSASLTFTYDSSHSRIAQASTISGTTTTTVYLNDPVSGAMAQRVTVGSGQPTFIDYVRVDGQIVAQRSLKAQAPRWGNAVWNGFAWGPPPGSLWGSTAGTNPPRFKWGTDPWSGPTVTWAYFVLDSLGSVAVIADQGGNVTQRLSYDAWGKQRNANGTDASCGSISPSTSRGFTNQEQVPGGCTVNLNARLYDPSIGKFMAADSVVDDPYAPNAFNRYAYVLNNPLSFTDPTGHSIFGSIFGAILDIAVLFVAPELEGYTLFGSTGLLASAATFDLTSIGILAANGAIGGGLSAGVSGGSVFKGALLGALQGGLSGYTGGLLAQEATSEGMAEAVGISASEAESTVSILGSNTADAIVANGLVGGIVSAAGGGPFGSGFLAAGVGSLAGPIGIAGGHFSTGNLVASAALGGVGSVLGGGKFANGAVTGAFTYAAGASYGHDNEQSAAGDLQANGSRTMVAGTHMDLSGAIVHDYDPPYYNYDPVSRESFDIHEDLHGEQLLSWYPHNAIGAIESLIDSFFNPSKFEIPAYTKQIDFLQNYLLSHPYSTTPNWAQVFKTQQQMEDSLEHYRSLQK